MSRVLVVLPDMPVPAVSGYHLRMLSNLAVAKRLGWTTTVAWFGDHAQEDHTPELLDADATFRIGGRSPRTRPAGRIAQRAAWAVKSISPWRRGSYPFSFPFESHRDDVIRASRDADAVILPTVLSHWVPDLRQPSLLIIGDCVDVLTDLTGRLLRANIRRRPQRIPSLAMNAAACHAQERRYLPQFDEIWATSDGEAQRARDLGAVRVVVVPSTNADWDLTPTSIPSEPTFGFIGNFHMSPNLEAADFLAREVLPIVRRKVPEVRLRLAGHGLPAHRFPATPGLEICGAVPDATAFVESCAVTALPVRVRGGVPLKLFETMALGRPSVVSPELIAGLPISPGTDVLVADSADGFAASVVTLLTDGAERETLAAHARRTFEERFSLSAAVAHARVESILG